MSATNGKKARLVFASDKVPGMHTLNFPIVSDGKEHIYNLDMLASPNWKDKIVAIGVQLGDEPNTSAIIRSLVIADEPQGPPQLSVITFGLDEASPRAGIPAKIIARISNTGGAAATQLHASLVLPDGIHMVSPPKTGGTSGATGLFGRGRLELDGGVFASSLRHGEFCPVCRKIQKA